MSSADWVLVFLYYLVLRPVSRVCQQYWLTIIISRVLLSPRVMERVWFANFPVYHIIRLPMFSRSFYLPGSSDVMLLYTHHIYLQLFNSKAMIYFNVNYNFASLFYYPSQSLAKPSCLMSI